MRAIIVCSLFLVFVAFAKGQGGTLRPFDTFLGDGIIYQTDQFTYDDYAADPTTDACFLVTLQPERDFAGDSNVPAFLVRVCQEQGFNPTTANGTSLGLTSRRTLSKIFFPLAGSNELLVLVASNNDIDFISSIRWFSGPELKQIVKAFPPRAGPLLVNQGFTDGLGNVYWPVYSNTNKPGLLVANTTSQSVEPNLLPIVNLPSGNDYFIIPGTFFYAPTLDVWIGALYYPINTQNGGYESIIVKLFQTSIGLVVTEMLDNGPYNPNNFLGVGLLSQDKGFETFYAVAGEDAVIYDFNLDVKSNFLIILPKDQGNQILSGFQLIGSKGLVRSIGYGADFVNVYDMLGVVITGTFIDSSGGRPLVLSPSTEILFVYQPAYNCIELVDTTPL